MASEAGKGGDRRPMNITQEQFASNFELAFSKQKLCGLCRKPVTLCGCCPTEDGPGQCANGCPRKTPYGDAACGDCLTRSQEDGPGQGSDEVKTHYERRRFNREGV